MELLDVVEEQHATCLTDIASAVKRDDRVEIRAVAHLLKGSSASLGAIRLLGLCQRMEHVGRAGDPGIDDEQLRELASAAVEASRALRQELI